MTHYVAPLSTEIAAVHAEFEHVKRLCLRVSWSEAEVVRAIEGLQRRVLSLLEDGSVEFWDKTP